jgi:hypothetical protein
MSSSKAGDGRGGGYAILPQGNGRGARNAWAGDEGPGNHNYSFPPPERGMATAATPTTTSSSMETANEFLELAGEQQSDA